MKTHGTPVSARLRGMVTRGKVISATLNPKRCLVQLSGLAGEIRQKIELFLPFGMSAYPSGGEDLILLQVGNSRSHLVALFADASGLRITDLQQGEFGWKDGNAQHIVLRSDRIEIVSPTKDIFITTPVGNVNINGVVIDEDGNITAPGTINAADEITAKNTHTVSGHIHSDPQGGSVGLPTG
jgi:phage gp45-like